MKILARESAPSFFTQIQHRAALALGQYERPFCEITHSNRLLTIVIKLPGIQRTDVHLTYHPPNLELLVEKRQRKLYREIPLPQTAALERATFHFARHVLTLEIPLRREP